jgi:hypothetical protein
MESRKRTALEASLDEWYAADDDRQRTLEDIVMGRAGVSLRTIDWFVTNMTARKPVVYTIPGKDTVVDVNGMYKDILRCYHKSGFDSFKRKGSNPAEAALRQRNFFRWALENGIVEYVKGHSEEIEQDMAEMRRHSKKSRHRATASKRKKGHAKGGVAITSHDMVMSVPNFARLEW